MTRNVKAATWEDLYFDGKIDDQYEMFEESTKEICTRSYIEDGWDKVDVEDKDEVGFVEDYSDDYYLQLMSGKIERIR